MKIGIVGYQKLTTEEVTSVYFLLDCILSRYTNQSNSIILGGHENVEGIAERVAIRRNWSSSNIKYVKSNAGKWINFTRKKIDERIATDCDMLISIGPRDYSSNYAVRKARSLGKVAWEYYV